MDPKLNPPQKMARNAGQADSRVASAAAQITNN